jgi:replicative DNA helicase
VSTELFEKPLPNALESEKTILGAVITDNGYMPQVADAISDPQWFYIPSNRKIWTAMLTLYEAKAEINPILVGEILKWDNDLKAVGGISYITTLTQSAYYVRNLKFHIDKLKEKFALRQQIRINYKYIERILEDDTEQASELLTLQENELSDLRGVSVVRAGAGGTLAELVPMIDSHLTLIESGQNPAIATSIPKLDAATGGGPVPGEMWGTAALSSQGKTALTLQEVKYMAEQGKHCIVFSLEMVTLMNCLRVLAAEAEIPMFHIKFGIDQNRINELRAALPQLAKLPIRIYNDCRSVGEMVSRIRMIKRREPVDVVAIDSFNRASGHGSGKDRYENRTQELKYIANAIQQQICQDENVAGLVPTQFNRTAWSASEPGPQHIDGGEAYYQACDLFAALKTKAAKKGAEMRESALTIYKQRNGPPGKVLLWFHGPSMTFSERKEKLADELDEGDPEPSTEAEPEPSPEDREHYI